MQYSTWRHIPEDDTAEDGSDNFLRNVGYEWNGMRKIKRPAPFLLLHIIVKSATKCNAPHVMRITKFTALHRWVVKKDEPSQSKLQPYHHVLG
jgi:hypothetical protein